MYGGRTAGMFGYSHFSGGFAGGQAEYVRVPYGDVNLLKLPDNVPDEQGLYLSDVIATSWHCVVDTGVKKGDVVAIWGAGKWLYHFLLPPTNKWLRSNWADGR
jgi:threonine dehydrogenase-like Zn-dependent dehydrogenase